MARKKTSLMFRLMTAVNVSALLILLALTSFILKQTTHSVEKQIDNEVSSLSESLKYTLANYVKENNIDNLKTLAKDIVDDETINEVFIFDKDKKLIATSKNADAEVHNKTEQIYTIKTDIIKLGEESAGPVGFIEIKYNHNDIIAVKKDFYIIGAISNIIAQILLSFVMWFFLSRSIKSINLTTDKLKSISKSTSDSSKEVESISESVSSSANEQAASIQETVATLDEITSQVTATADSVTNSTKKSEESLHIANEGKLVVTEMITSMEAIGKSNQDIMDEIARGNERIGGLVKIINEISQKTAVINDIVFQTKLLSFNASVEAARAGEHGKGFAVVAEEVGKLAQMSGTASTEISAILNDSIVKVNSVIEETNRNVKVLTDAGSLKVSDGKRIADKCGSVLEDIVTNAAIVKNMMTEISVASKEQEEGVRNIAAAMNQLDQATLSNNKAAAQSSESSKQLLNHSTSLQHAVVELETEILGGVSQEKKAEAPIKHVKQETAKAVKKDNVIHMPVKAAVKAPVKAAQKPAPKAEAKKLATVEKTHQMKATGTTPAHDDPRFEDV